MSVCETCGRQLPPPGPNSPAVRYCQDDWWAIQNALPAAERHPLATWAIGYRKAAA